MNKSRAATFVRRRNHLWALLVCMTLLSSPYLASPARGWGLDITLRDQSSFVRSITYSPDGSIMITGSRDSGLFIYDENNTPTHATGIQGYDVTFTPNGTQLVTAEDTAVRIWSFPDLNLTTSLNHTSARSLSIHPTEPTLATAGGSSVKIWNTSDWSQITQLDFNGMITSVSFSTDGAQLAFGTSFGPTAAHIHDTATWNETHVLPHGSYIKDLQFADPHTLLVLENAGTLRRWNVTTESNTANTSADNAIAVHGDLAAVGTGEDVTILDWRNWTISESLQGHYLYVLSLEFSPDGTELTSGAEDWWVKRWDIDLDASLVGDLSHFYRRGHPHLVQTITAPSAFVDFTVAEGSIWALDVNGMLSTYDPGGNLTAEVDLTPAIGLSVSPDGMLAALSVAENESIEIWDLSGPSIVAEIPNNFNPVGSLEARGVMSFSADGDLLASATYDNHVAIWNTTSWQLVEVIRGSATPYQFVRFGIDPDILGLAIEGDELQVFETGGWNRINTSDEPGPSEFEFHPESDDEIVLENGSIEIRSANSSQQPPGTEGDNSSFPIWAAIIMIFLLLLTVAVSMALSRSRKGGAGKGS